MKEEDLERALAGVRKTAAGPIEGGFGPNSVTWQIHREAAVFLGAGRALLLQLAHPWIAAGVAEHSSNLADPIGRFHRTFNAVFTMAFGRLDQATAMARRLHHRHAAIRGIMPAAVSPFPAGSGYCANDLRALMWVQATLTETSLLVAELVFPALTKTERECYYAESRQFAGLFGIPISSLRSRGVALCCGGS